MSDRHSPLRHILYRIYRLRRLLLLEALILSAAATASALLQPQLNPYDTPLAVLGFLAIYGTFSLIDLTLYPQSWLGSLSASLIFAAAFFAVPHIMFYLYSGQKLGQIEDFNWPLWIAIAFVVLLIAQNILARTLITLLQRIPMPVQHVKSRRRLRVTPEDLRDAVFTLPAQRTGRKICGEVEEDGFFEVSILSSATPRGQEKVVAQYRARILEQEPFMQLVEGVVEQADGSQRRAISRTRILPDGSGSIYEFEEEHNLFSLLQWLGFYLTDFTAEYLRAEIDDHFTRPTLAVLQRPQRELFADLLPRFIARRLVPA